jgi:GNAT superfamily N-acetyltransferase
MLDMMYRTDSLEKQLQNNRIFLLAEEDNRFVGFASYELNCDTSNTTKIHKLYVLPETQGKGVGRQLIAFISDIALANQNPTLILTVNKYNKAKDFYLKNGFEITNEAVFDIGNGYVMDDYIMEKKL